MKKLQVAVIGCGTIANSAHIPAYLKSEAEIRYFCDIIPERADAAVEKYGCGKAVYDYHEILDDPELDAVSVCTPNNVHKDISIDFLKHGKHVLCEKPAARNLEDTIAMQKAQHETGKVLNIGVVNRFNTGVNKLKNLIDKGFFGEIYHVYASFRSSRSIPGLGGMFTTKEISGGGVLIDWGVHFLDLIMYCVGDPKAKTVSATTYSKLCDNENMKDYSYTSMWAGPPDYNGTYDVEEFITGHIRTEGPTINLQGAWAQNIANTEMYIDFLGTKAGARLKYGENFTIFYGEDNALYESTPKYESTNHFENEINAFLSCIQTGEKLPSHIDTNMVTARLMQALYDSAEAGREVVLD